MRRLFIVGAGRSGSKFLMNVLNGSEFVHLVPEVHYFSVVYHDGFRKQLRRICGKGGEYTLDGLVTCLLESNLFGTYWRRDHRITKGKVLAHFQTRELSDRNIYDFLLEHDRIVFASHKTSIRFLGEKGGANVFSLGELMAWYPDAVILFIYRNPLPVLNSEVNKDLKPDYPIKKSNPLYPYGLAVFVFLTWLWGAVLTLFYNRNNPGRIYIIRYESMVENLERVVIRLCRLLELPFDKSLCDVEKVDSSFGADRSEPAWFAPPLIRGFYKIFLGPLKRLLDRKAI